jgi:hypothetical protein
VASSIIPEGQDAELMGIFLFAGQCLSWIPPLVFTAINEAGVSQRIGVASLDVYFFLSFLGYCCMGSYAKAREEVNRESAFSAATGKPPEIRVEISADDPKDGAMERMETEESDSVERGSVKA